MNFKGEFCFNCSREKDPNIIKNYSLIEAFENKWDLKHECFLNSD